MAKRKIIGILLAALLLLAAGAGWLLWLARPQTVLPAGMADEALVSVEFCGEDVTANMDPDAVVQLLEHAKCRRRWWRAGRSGGISQAAYPWRIDVVLPGRPCHVALGTDGFCYEDSGRGEYALEDPALLEAALLTLLESGGVPLENGRLPADLHQERAAIFYGGHLYYGGLYSGLYDLPELDDAVYLGDAAAASSALPASELACTWAACQGRPVYGFTWEGRACFALSGEFEGLWVLVDGAYGLCTPAVTPPVAAPDFEVGMTYFYADGHSVGVAPHEAAEMHAAALPGLTALTETAPPADLGAALETAKATGQLLELRYAQPALWRREEPQADGSVTVTSFRYDRAYLIVRAGDAPLADGAVVLGGSVYTGFQPPAALTALLEQEAAICYEMGIWP